MELATCEICGKQWNTLDPDVRFVHGDGRWECADEVACFDRRAMQRGLDAAWAAVDLAATFWLVAECVRCTEEASSVMVIGPRDPDSDDPWAQDEPIGQERAAQIRGEAEDRPGSSNASQHQQLGILYGQLGITERATRLEEMTDRVGREIGSAKDLSYAEAEQAIRQLRELVTRESETSEKGAN